VQKLFIKNEKRTVLIHRYNTRDDTFIEYYATKTTIIKNIWKAYGNTIYYEIKE